MAEGGMNLDQQFLNFTKFGDDECDGKTITLTKLDKWLQQAQILGKYESEDGKIRITHTDTGVCYNKFKSRLIDYQQFLKFLDDLAARKEVSAADLKEKLMNCGLPGATKAQQQAAAEIKKEQ